MASKRITFVKADGTVLTAHTSAYTLAGQARALGLALPQGAYRNTLGEVWADDATLVGQFVPGTSTTVRLGINGDDLPLNVEFDRDDNGDYVGNVDGVAFRFKSASRATAERERLKAARALAAWTAVINSMP